MNRFALLVSILIGCDAALAPTTLKESCYLTQQQIIVQNAQVSALAIADQQLAVGVSYQNADDGAVYIYAKEQDQYHITQTLDGLNHERFGQSVAFSKETLFVGASNAAIGKNRVGIVYVFTQSPSRSFETFEYSKTLTGSVRPFDLFGATISADEQRLAVGSFQDGVRDEGAVYIFSRTSNWELEQKIPSPTTSSFTAFGAALSIKDDLLVVGAEADSEKAVFAGAAYIFTRRASWQQTAKLTVASANESEFFGTAVATDGLRVAVGAPFGHIGSAIYVYDHNLDFTVVRGGNGFGTALAASNGRFLVNDFRSVTLFDSSLTEQALMEKVGNLTAFDGKNFAIANRNEVVTGDVVCYR